MPRQGTIRSLRPVEVGRTLAEDLVGVADDVRALYTEFGLRPYRVWLVWVAWRQDENADGVIDDGEDRIDVDERGAGRPELLAEIELLPTPRVGPLSGVRQDLDAVGLTERGGLTLDQVSPSYAEDLLMGLLEEFRDPARPNQLKAGISFFYEVQENRQAGHSNWGTAGGEMPASRRPPRRKFVPAGTPTRSADGFQWSFDLVRADGERGREGEIGEVLP